MTTIILDQVGLGFCSAFVARTITPSPLMIAASFFHCLECRACIMSRFPEIERVG
jgi:hypothetical protein